MATCTCGKKARWMSDVCDECLDARVNSAPESFAVAEEKRLALIAEGNAILRLTTTGQELPGYRVTQTFGIVRGIVVRGRGPIGSFAAGVQIAVGAEVTLLVTLSERARVQAMERMAAQAHALGANAILAMDYDMTDIGGGVIEVLAYGTAVRVEALENV